MQQELMQKRKSGALIKEANERRKKVAETLEERRALRRAEKEALARGEMPDTLQNWKVRTAAFQDRPCNSLQLYHCAPQNTVLQAAAEA